MATLFFSYSHNDEDFRDQIEKHLSLLKRQGLITTWHDRKILVGKEFHGEISNSLDNSDIILLLISPNFLASDYCFDIEMKRAIEKHENGESIVIPIILHPCDWQNSPFGKLLVVPKDGKPISQFSNHHDAYLEIAQSVRNAITEIGINKDDNFVLSDSINLHDQTSNNRSKNFKIRKVFSDHEKDTFLEKSFEYIAQFFQNTLTELSKRNNAINKKFTRIDSNHFSAIIYVNGQISSQCRIWLEGSGSLSYGIVYSSNAFGNDNSYNESLFIEDDGYDLYFKPLGISNIGIIHNQNKLLSMHEAAEFLWSIIIQPLQ